MTSTPEYRYQPLSGRDIAAQLDKGLQLSATDLRTGYGIIPRLEILSNNGGHGPSKQYVGLKQKVGTKLGFEVNTHFVDSSDQLREMVHDFNTDKNVHGIIVQLPLKDGEAPEEVVNHIAAKKDVDGLGRRPEFDPATPSAILKLLHGHGIIYHHKPTALVGRGKLVGAPLYRMMREQGARHIQVIDEFTSAEEKKAILNDAFVVISAVGKKVLDATSFDDYTRPKVIVDAGTAEEGNVIVGDVTDELREAMPEHWCATDKIGGVGPLTIRRLLRNVALAAESRIDE